MSEYNIPFHIQEEIMKRLPVKSLVQFRSVSKAWKSLIDSSGFIAAHTLHRNTRPQQLLVSYENQEPELNCVCFEDDDTFPQQRSIQTLPLSVKPLAHADIAGISHGLVCFYYPDTKLAVIWNPSIRKLIFIAVPGKPFADPVGFGVCPATNDPKIVAVTQSWDEANIETSYKCEVMIYSLSSGNWRSLSINLPTKPFNEICSGVAAEGFIYWLGGLLGDNVIILFDVTNETFQMIDLPTTLTRDPGPLNIYKLRGSLTIVQYDRNMDVYTVWKMEGGVQRSFTKLFTIHASDNLLVGFRKSGVPILRVLNDEQIKLVVYEPNLEHNNVLQVSGDPRIFTVDSYTETLLLLGRSDCSSY